MCIRDIALAVVSVSSPHKLFILLSKREYLLYQSIPKTFYLNVFIKFAGVFVLQSSGNKQHVKEDSVVTGDVQTSTSPKKLTQEQSFELEQLESENSVEHCLRFMD